jgi:hypothetical protein
MPYNRPGPGVYVVNGATPVQHGAPVAQNGFVGVAVKQQSTAWDAGLQAPAMIAAGEPYFIITKGVVQVTNAGISANVKGDPIYISAGPPAALNTTNTNAKFGRIVEVTGNRGVPAGRVRIDLDSKDSF